MCLRLPPGPFGEHTLDVFRDPPALVLVDERRLAIFPIIFGECAADGRAMEQQERMRFVGLCLRLADRNQRRLRVAGPFVETDATEARLAQRTRQRFSAGRRRVSRPGSRTTSRGTPNAFR